MERFLSTCHLLHIPVCYRLALCSQQHIERRILSCMVVALWRNQQDPLFRTPADAKRCTGELRVKELKVAFSIIQRFPASTHVQQFLQRSSCFRDRYEDK